MNNLESKFKQALENHEVDYNPQAWDAFKQKLDAQPSVPNGGSKTLAKLGIAATVVTTLSIGAYFLFNGSGSDAGSAKNQNDQVNVIENQSENNQKDQKDLMVNNGGGNPAVINHNPSDNHNDEVIEEIKNEPYKSPDLNEGDQNTNIVDFKFNPVNPVVKDENNLVPDHNPNKSDEQKLVLNANFSVNVISGCEGLTCQFSPKQDQSYKGDYVWDFGDGTFSKERNPSHTYDKPGNFVVKLALRSEINNEVISDQAQEYITVYPKPKASFEIDEMSSGTAIPEYDFINTTDRATSWIWTFGDNASSTKKDPSHTYRKKGMYKVKLTAENSFGCQSVYTKTVAVDNDYNLLAPTGFTPNGDGLNDNFIPKALEIMNAEFTMSIFHKNGQLYYETNQVSRPWDGRYMMDNQNAPGGAYVWVVQLKNKNGETEVYKGSVTLLRD